MSVEKPKKIEHAGAKNGGGFWGTREEAKRGSRLARRRESKRMAESGERIYGHTTAGEPITDAMIEGDRLWFDMKWDAEDAAEDDFSRGVLIEQGFVGWLPLLSLDTASVPTSPGVYVVWRDSDDEPAFLPSSPAGRFKDRDPSFPPEQLSARWTRDHLLYIGKAGNLHRRLREYAKHGASSPIGHMGGRAIWQLSDAAELVVAWRAAVGEDPRDRERAYLAAFKEWRGALPFANRAG